MRTVWDFYFGWYQGAVYSNLIASVISTGAAGALVAWRAVKHLHAVHAEQHEQREQQHAEHKAELAQMLADHHAAVVAAVTPQENA